MSMHIQHVQMHSQAYPSHMYHQASTPSLNHYTINTVITSLTTITHHQQHSFTLNLLAIIITYPPNTLSPHKYLNKHIITILGSSSLWLRLAPRLLQYQHHDETMILVPFLDLTAHSSKHKRFLASSWWWSHKLCLSSASRMFLSPSRNWETTLILSIGDQSLCLGPYNFLEPHNSYNFEKKIIFKIFIYYYHIHIIIILKILNII